MPVDITIQGANELALIARRLKQTGDSDLRKELFRGLNAATKPLKEDVKKSARERLPRKGGLNELIASSKLATANRGSGKNPGVRISAKLAGHALAAIDRGDLRHPVFANPNVWVTQKVEPEFFTEPLEDGADKVRDELLDVLEAVARKLVDG